MKRIILGDNAEVLPTPAGALRAPRLHRPALQHRQDAEARPHPRDRATDGAGDRGGFGGRRYDVESVESGSYGDRFDDFEAFLVPAHRGRAPLHDARRVALRPPRLPRGPLRQGRPRPAPRARSLHERDHLGVRLRRAPEEPVAGQARHDPLVRARPRTTTSSTTTRWIASRTWRPGLVSQEKAERGKTPTDVWWHTIVPDERAREDRVPHAEAARRPEPHRQGALSPRRRRARLLRRQRDDRRGRGAQRPRLRARRRRTPRRSPSPPRASPRTRPSCEGFAANRPSSGSSATSSACAGCSGVRNRARARPGCGRSGRSRACGVLSPSGSIFFFHESAKMPSESRLCATSWP